MKVEGWLEVEGWLDRGRLTFVHNERQRGTKSHTIHKVTATTCLQDANYFIMLDPDKKLQDLV